MAFLFYLFEWPKGQSNSPIQFTNPIHELPPAFELPPALAGGQKNHFHYIGFSQIPISFLLNPQISSFFPFFLSPNPYYSNLLLYNIFHYLSRTMRMKPQCTEIYIILHIVV